MTDIAESIIEDVMASEEPVVAVTPKVVPVGVRVGQYVDLRDKIRELDDAHKEMMAPYRDALEALNSAILDALNKSGVDNVSTPYGTAYRAKRESVSINDPSVFRNFVVTQGLFDLQDVKANITAVKEFIALHNAPPPGTTFKSADVVNVRKK